MSEVCGFLIPFLDVHVNFQKQILPSQARNPTCLVNTATI